MANRSQFGWDKLDAGQRRKLDACKTPEDVLVLAKESGYELSDEELDQVVGGGSWGQDDVAKCPCCGSTSITPQGMHSYECSDCHKHFTLNTKA